MQKIPSVFKRDYEGTRLVYDEVVEGCEWALTDKAIPTVKLDGTSCLWQDGTLYKRYDRKVSRAAKKRGAPFSKADFKPAPKGWIAAESEPNYHTGHWPGWLAVDPEDPADQWHTDAMRHFDPKKMPEGTYELIGEKIQGNPYRYPYPPNIRHKFFKHGLEAPAPPLRTFGDVKDALQKTNEEGFVFYHRDDFKAILMKGLLKIVYYIPIVDKPRMAKVKRKDFGLEWPVIPEWMQSTEDKENQP